MSNHLIAEIRLEGSVPSKKNQRINTREGKSFPSKEFEQWQEDAMWQVRAQVRNLRIYVPVAIEVTVLFGRNSRADLDNRLTSILDMLVEAMVLRDDRFEHVPQMSVRAKYEKGAKPAALIRITEVEPVV